MCLASFPKDIIAKTLDIETLFRYEFRRVPFDKQVILESREAQSAGTKNQSLAAVLLEGFFERVRTA